MRPVIVSKVFGEEIRILKLKILREKSIEKMGRKLRDFEIAKCAVSELT
jgi:hypothetical protein